MHSKYFKVPLLCLILMRIRQSWHLLILWMRKLSLREVTLCFVHGHPGTCGGIIPSPLCEFSFDYPGKWSRRKHRRQIRNHLKPQCYYSTLGFTYCFPNLLRTASVGNAEEHCLFTYVKGDKTHFEKLKKRTQNQLLVRGVFQLMQSQLLHWYFSLCQTTVIASYMFVCFF